MIIRLGIMLAEDVVCLSEDGVMCCVWTLSVYRASSFVQATIDLLMS